LGTRRVTILGSTGSIGRQALAVIASQDDLRVAGLAAGNNWRLLAQQAATFRPQAVALAAQRHAGDLAAALPAGVELVGGPDAMTQLVRNTRPDVLLSGVMGSAGLAPTLAAIECGSALAIANKETLVMAGAIVVPAARQAGVPLLPVDSEHSAVFQCLAAGRSEEVRRVILTASGGALRDWTDEAADDATVEQALRHPTWSMGRKITVDSATLMNKALEVVEAHWLFDLPPEKIEVLLHGESIVHSMVEFRDGSVIAQLGRPDMATPIAYALNWPRRAQRAAAPLDLPAIGRLTFGAPTPRMHRAVALGFAAIRRGGTAGAVLNAANEAAVEAFLAGRIRFGRIVDLVETIVNHAPASDEVSLDALVAADAWARQEVARGID
jgi:1-deoxy-D-xylulose-5-phosphate reductoisomerase